MRSDGQVKKALDRDGVVRLGPVMTRSQVDTVLRWLETRDLEDEVCLQSMQPEFDLSACGQRRLRKIRRLFWSDPGFWSQVLVHSEIGRIVRDVVGPHAALIFHAAFMKPGRIGSRTAFHQDQALWESNYPDALTIWTALTPCHSLNGCLMGYVGSHLGMPIQHQFVKGYEWHSSIPDAHFVGQKPSLYEMEPGEALAWHPLFVHGSEKNRSNVDRKAIVAVFTNASHAGFQAKDSFLLAEMERIASVPVDRIVT